MGGGTLTVTANYKNGIASRDDFVITDGTLADGTKLTAVTLTDTVTRVSDDGSAVTGGIGAGGGYGSPG